MLMPSMSERPLQLEIITEFPESSESILAAADDTIIWAGLDCMLCGIHQWKKQLSLWIYVAIGHLLVLPAVWWINRKRVFWLGFFKWALTYVRARFLYKVYLYHCCNIFMQFFNVSIFIKSILFYSRNLLLGVIWLWRIPFLLLIQLLFFLQLFSNLVLDICCSGCCPVVIWWLLSC